MKHNEEFADFLRDHVNLNQGRIEELDQHVKAVTSYLRNNLTGFRRVEYQGSRALGTIIRPVKDRHEFDADLLVIVDKDGNVPNPYSDTLWETLKDSDRYKEKIELWNRCVKVKYQGQCHLDTVPCVEDDGKQYVCPRNGDELEETDGTGLARLARHVIATFIQRQPKVYREEYDYQLEQPGVAIIELEPRYWVGRADNLHHNAGRRRLEGFLKQATACLLEEQGASVTNLQEMLAEVEKMLPQMSTHQLRPFIALYILYSSMVRDGRMDNCDLILERYGHELDDPSVEAMLTLLLLEHIPDWDLAEHQEVHDAYFREKHHRNGLRVPPALEAGLCLALAERYRLAGNVIQARDLIIQAVDNHPGHAPLWDLEQSFDPNETVSWRNVIAPPSAEETDGGNDC